MDNCSIHHIAPVTNLITDVGAMVHYLPPYSPDYNPIEWCFSKLKNSLEQVMELTNDIELVARSALDTITPQDCQNWISGCKIYT